MNLTADTTSYTADTTLLTADQTQTSGAATDAFQQGSFQYPGFQTSPIYHSQDAFQRCSFQFNAFQTSPCPPGKSDRSGWWRMWLYDLQEEALKQYVEKTGHRAASQAPLEVEVGSDLDADIKTTEKKKPTPRRVVRVRKAKEPARRAPTVRFTPSAPSDFEQITPVLHLLSTELYGWYRQHEPLRLAGLEAAATRAANDEDEDILLLLAA